MDGSANSLSADSAGMTLEDLAALRRAARSLEHPGFAARLTNMLGRAIELIGHALPASASQVIAAATSKGLEAALKVALGTMRRSPHAASQLLHKALATASGAAGGAFGLAALPFELPVSTIIMLRSIADIARSEGEHLSDPDTALSCLQVFALGGRAGSTDTSESGYFAVRGMLAKTVTEAARFLAERGIIQDPRALYHASGFPLWTGCDAKARGAGTAGRRCVGRSSGELRLHRTFPGCGSRSFHCSAT